jgi:hypothetical protein
VDFWAKQNGFVVDGWKWCVNMNLTDFACPVSQYMNSTDFKFIVAIHNPANFAIYAPSIGVPNGHLKV